MQDVDTPALVVNLDQMEKNIAAMASFGRTHDLAIRPHIKSHKIPELAWKQVKAGAVGITCQKLGEAEVMADAGLSDILVSYPIIGPLKLRRLMDLAQRVSVTTLVDSLAGAAPLSAAAQAEGLTLDVVVEVDDGYHRCGVPPEEVPPLARAVAHELRGLRFVGILAYEGHIYDLASRDAIRRAALESYDLMGRVADALRADGIPPERVSVGASSIAYLAAEHPAVTELRPGTYIFNDRSQLSIGAATVDECALFVLATVVSVPAQDRAIIDAGTKALTFSPIAGVSGYGQIVGHEESAIARLADEHGIIEVPDGARPFHVGERVMVIPNSHAPVVNAFSDLIGMRNDSVECVWQIAARGRMQ
jgi:D-serine deaminase-like pyridoxal phosphate-dependent protein